MEVSFNKEAFCYFKQDTIIDQLSTRSYMTDGETVNNQVSYQDLMGSLVYLSALSSPDGFKPI